MYKIAFRYWLFHKKSFFSIILTIAISMASIMSCAFLVRGMFVKRYVGFMDAWGNYDYIFLDIDDGDYNTIEDSGLFERGGTLKIYGEIDSVSEETFSAGYVDESGRELYHHSCSQGSYPADRQEITATKECLEALGVEPEIGAGGHLKINCADGSSYEDDFVVAGILCDLKQKRNLYGYSNLKYPEIFFYDLGITSTQYFIGIENLQYDKDENEDAILEFAGEKGFKCEGVYGFISSQSILLPMEGTLTRENVEATMPYIQKDFNSAVLVPAFSVIIALLSAISIYAALSSTFQERRKSLDLIRCVGLTKKKMLAQVMAETGILSEMGILLGYGLGILWYGLILSVQKNLFHTRIYPAFKAEKIVRYATADPYTYPLAICLECVAVICVLLFIHMYATTDRFVFMTQPEDAGRKIFRRQADGSGAKSGRRILGKCFAGRTGSRIFLSILMVCLISVGSFCCLYFAESYHYEVEFMLMLEDDGEINDEDFDYAAYKDFAISSCAVAGSNRHHGGIAPEAIKSLEESAGITRIRYAIEARSTKIMIKEEEDKEIQEFLKESDVRVSAIDYLGELNKKTDEHLGYGGYCRYNIPTVGINRPQLQSLEDCIVSGAADWEALRQGREVILARQKDTDCPYRVGDVIQMTDLVQDNEEDEKFNFSGGVVPENATPAFRFHYLDEEGKPEEDEWDGYVFGSRTDYEVRVGAVMEIEKDTDESFYWTESLVGKNRVEFLCAMDAFEAWGLPDRNITKVELSLDEPLKRKEVSRLWYNILGNSVDMSGTSSIARAEKKKTLFTDHISIVAAIVVVLLLCSALGCFHMIQRELLYKEETYRKLRELGMSRKRICLQVLKENLKYPLTGVMVGWLPMAVFDRIGDMAGRKMDGVVSWLGRAPWYVLYPYSYRLLNNSTAVVMLAGFLVTCLLVVYVAVRTLRRILE